MSANSHSSPRVTLQAVLEYVVGGLLALGYLFWKARESDTLLIFAVSGPVVWVLVPAIVFLVDFRHWDATAAIDDALRVGLAPSRGALVLTLSSTTILLMTDGPELLLTVWHSDVVAAAVVGAMFLGSGLVIWAASARRRIAPRGSNRARLQTAEALGYYLSTVVVLVSLFSGIGVTASWGRVMIAVGVSALLLTLELSRPTYAAASV